MDAIIRLAAATDGSALAAIYRPAVVETSTSFELEPPDGAEMARRVTRTLERTPWLVYEERGDVIGYAYAGLHRERPAYQWSVEVSAYVHPRAQRRGVARALYTSLFAALAVQGFRNAYAGITLPNDASVGLHTSLGFTLVGVYRASATSMAAGATWSGSSGHLLPASTNPRRHVRSRVAAAMTLSPPRSRRVSLRGDQPRHAGRLATVGNADEVRRTPTSQYADGHAQRHAAGAQHGRRRRLAGAEEP